MKTETAIEQKQIRVMINLSPDQLKKMQEDIYKKVKSELLAFKKQQIKEAVLDLEATLFTPDGEVSIFKDSHLTTDGIIIKNAVNKLKSLLTAPKQSHCSECRFHDTAYLEDPCNKCDGENLWRPIVEPDVIPYEVPRGEVYGGLKPAGKLEGVL